MLTKKNYLAFISYPKNFIIKFQVKNFFGVAMRMAVQIT